MIKELFWIIVLMVVFLLLSIAVSAQNICQYAGSATATSEHSSSLASYAIGAPNAPKVGQCNGWDEWSGYGYSWTPTNWNVKATLTLNYNTPVYARNFTIYGDYDMCWNRIWLRNGAAGQERLVFDGYDESCVSTHKLNGDFLANTIILETCEWSWSATDSVELCGGTGASSPVCGNGVLEIGEECDDANLVDGDGCSSKCLIETAANLVEICDWQGCKAGAASVSIDDSYTSCRDKLNANGWKGTYFLLNTKAFSQSTWNLWKEIYNEGHELGCHTQTHPCWDVDDNTLRYEISSNINDILTNLNIPAEEITSFAWPCGFNTWREKEIASEYFISARAYHVNELEDKNPLDFMDIKSLNTPDYHDPPYQPPSYFEMADLAESSGKWVNFVFHNECSDDGAIDYLASKNLWVAPLGRVAKYIRERQNAQIQNLVQTNSEIRFNLASSLNPILFNQELSLRVYVDEIEFVLVNNIASDFVDSGNLIIFNVRPTGNDEIRVIKQQPANCIDNDKDNYYATAGDCPIGDDCNDNDAAIHPGASETACNGIDDDCDGLKDEDYVSQQTSCGVGACYATGSTSCVGGLIVNSCTPGMPSPEVCEGSIDEDCDGTVDEGCVCTPGQTRNCAQQNGVCAGSQETCNAQGQWPGCDYSAIPNYQAIESSCDNLDNDCDGNVDEGCAATSICQYASSATATSEHSSSLASYAIGAPNAPKVGQCNGWDEWSGYGYSWTPTNWNVKATLTLNYNTPVYARNFTIYGDYDMCWNRIWLRNGAAGQERLVFDGYDENCISTHKLNGDFLANTIILETCGWSWSATDSVQLCGKV